MGREPKAADSLARKASPSPLDSKTWATVAKTLRLSPQQKRIVGLLLQGMQDKQIARDTGLSVATIRTYLSRIFQRLGVSDRVELILRVFMVARSVAPPCRCHQSR